MTALSQIVETVCDELTLEHILVGVPCYSLDLVPKKEKVTDEQVTGAKKKRESKKALKEQEKMAKIEANDGVNTTLAQGMTAETPLKLNFAMLVA